MLFSDATWWATTASSEPQQTPIYSECSGNKPKPAFHRKMTARALSLSKKDVWIETTDKTSVLIGCFTVSDKNISRIFMHKFKPVQQKKTAV